MPLIYRSMKIDAATGKPALGRSASTLGVRVYTNSRHDDVKPDANGVISSEKGMSVSPAARYLPIHRVYEKLGHIVEGASATDASLHIWKMGSGPFIQEIVVPDLMLRPDPPNRGIVNHGEVTPAQAMPLADYEQALANTQDLWAIDESGA